MEYLVSAEEMRRYDAYTVKELGVPEIVLMERAAAGACSFIVDDIARRELEFPRVTVLCGTGNNGGDGLAVARMLYQKGISVKAYLIGDPAKATKSNILETQIARKYGVDLENISCAECAERMRPEDNRADIVVDALFGVGLNRPLSGDHADLTEAVNCYGAYVYALDIPSGVYADGGGCDNPCIRADVTLTFGFIKMGQMILPGASFCGEVVRIDMGIDECSIYDEGPVCRRITSRDEIGWPVRVMQANKGTYGKLLVIAGSRDIYGAAYMAAAAAFAMGAGMVRIVTHAENRVALQTALPEAMYTFYDDGADMSSLLSPLYDWADAILIGPGIGTGADAESLVSSALFDNELPILVDADAIRLIADNDEWERHLRTQKGRRVIMTPHMGEFAYLAHTSVAYEKENCLMEAKNMADKLGITIIVKDARSIIASYDHREIYVNTSGNEGMATAGSGDVLAGMCAVMMMQSDDALDAAAGAAYIHGAAGDDAARRCGGVGMTASDIIDSIRETIG